MTSQKPGARAGEPDRVLLLMPTTTYRGDDFLLAADGLGIEVVLGTDRCHVLDALGAVTTARRSLVLDFTRPEDAVNAIRAFADQNVLSAIIATDDATTVVSALAARALGLQHNDPRGAVAARDKLRLRSRMHRSGIPQARWIAVRASRGPELAAQRVERAFGYPCVLKPRMLSASRGVIRANDRATFVEAFFRVANILGDAEVKARTGRAHDSIIIESFLSGQEVAVEAIVTRGELEILAVFDKPDRLDGPFFEETLYITPSRLPDVILEDVKRVIDAAAHALGLAHGPVHAEARIVDGRAFLIEIQARAIGGLCARTLRFGLGMSLESLILQHAIGTPVVRTRNTSASGVMMLPIRKTGVFKRIEGVEEARGVSLVEDVVITAPIGREIVALPEGSSYLGFVFARGDDPASVEAALRSAAAKLTIEIASKIPVVTS